MTHSAKIVWKRGHGEPFVDNKYSRAHTWSFDGGIEVAASSSPQAVPLPMSKASAVDPEEAFVASISSCHMLWFLSIAARLRFLVERYEDNPEGRMEQNGDGAWSMTAVILKPEVLFDGDRIPSPRQLDELHELAHESCYIANSVRTEIRIIPIKT